MLSPREPAGSLRHSPRRARPFSGPSPDPSGVSRILPCVEADAAAQAANHCPLPPPTVIGYSALCVTSPAESILKHCTLWELAGAEDLSIRTCMTTEKSLSR